MIANFNFSKTPLFLLVRAGTSLFKRFIGKNNFVLTLILMLNNKFHVIVS